MEVNMIDVYKYLGLLDKLTWVTTQHNSKTNPHNRTPNTKYSIPYKVIKSHCYSYAPHAHLISCLSSPLLTFKLYVFF